MKQFCILICLLSLLASTSYGQFWNKAEAEYTFHWHEYFAGNYLGYKQLTNDSDTLIDGKLFTRYHDYSVTYDGGTNAFDSIYFDTVSVLTDIAFYEEDGILYAHHVNNPSFTIDTLYNFKAALGDSWTLPQWYVDSTVNGFSYYCDSLITVAVLDTGHMSLQNISLYYLTVEYGGFQIYGGAGLITVTDTIFERFGSKMFSFLSIYRMCVFNAPYNDGGTIYNLTCYSDSEIDFGQECTSLNVIINGVNNERQAQPKIYPNPANSVVRVQTNSKKIRLTDIFGKVLISKEVENGMIEMDVSNLANGVYFIQNQEKTVRKLIVQH